MSARVVVTARQFVRTAEPQQLLEAVGCEVVLTKYALDQSDASAGGDEIAQLLSGADAAIVGTCRLTREVLSRVSSLKLIARRGVGFDSVDVLAATELGIPVSITRGAVEEAVADHAFALMLAAARRVVEADRLVRTGGWDPPVGVELHAKTLGIVGLGVVGRGVAARARGFEMRVLAHDPFLSESPDGVELVGLSTVLEQADFVSISVALTPQTRGLIGGDEIAAMKRGAIIVNTSRGGVLDEGALAEALRSDALAGAGLDTFEVEPPNPGDPLFELPNVVLSPHSAGYTLESTARANRLAAEAVVSVLNGERLSPNVLANPEVYSDSGVVTGGMPS